MLSSVVDRFVIVHTGWDPLDETITQDTFNKRERDLCETFKFEKCEQIQHFFIDSLVSHSKHQKNFLNMLELSTQQNLHRNRRHKVHEQILQKAMKERGGDQEESAKAEEEAWKGPRKIYGRSKEVAEKKSLNWRKKDRVV